MKKLLKIFFGSAYVLLACGTILAAAILYLSYGITAPKSSAATYLPRVETEPPKPPYKVIFYKDLEVEILSPLLVKTYTTRDTLLYPSETNNLVALESTRVSERALYAGVVYVYYPNGWRFIAGPHRLWTGDENEYMFTFSYLADNGGGRIKSSEINLKDLTPQWHLSSEEKRIGVIPSDGEVSWLPQSKRIAPTK